MKKLSWGLKDCVFSAGATPDLPRKHASSQATESHCVPLSFKVKRLKVSTTINLFSGVHVLHLDIKFTRDFHS